MKYLLLPALLALAACGNGQEQTTATDSTSDDHTGMDHDGMDHSGMNHDGMDDDRMTGSASADAAVPAAVSAPWTQATTHYLALKNALVGDDLQGARAHAEELTTALGAADMSAMGASHDAWMQHVPKLQASAKEIAAATDIEAARQAFSAMSEPMVAAVRAFGDGGATLYVQHCPMAFDNAGADWVSSESDIKNPYFGSAMLTCGKVTEEL